MRAVYLIGNERNPRPAAHAPLAVYISGRVEPLKRRRAIRALAGIALAPLVARAQQPGRVHRLGMLYFASPPSTGERQRHSAYLVPAALRDLGYVEGRNIVIERRHAEDKAERLAPLARELAQLRVDAVIAVGLSAVRAAKEASATIPIVLYGNFDPVANGIVSNLARPGGNVTGVLIAPEGTLASKKLELLRETAPKAARLALLAPADPGFARQLREAQAAAQAIGVPLDVVEVRDASFERAFASISAQKAGALFVGAHQSFMVHRNRIIELAARHRLPAIYEWAEQVEDGGLMAYGTSLSGLARRTAIYVDRIFKGAKAGDLPIEQPTRFELVINLRTAKALGLAIPQSLLLRADRMIE
jgi:putative ABC transport system substrate-binding protein